MPQLDAALVGAGFIGPVHVEALRRLGRPMVGVLSSSPDRTQAIAKTLNIFKAYRSFDELLADPDIKVVHVATPNRHHYDQCRRVLEAGKHVICEKPLGMNSRETADLAALAQSRPKQVAAVCFNVRFYPLCLEARQWVTENQLGTIYHITGSYVQDWLLRKTDFNWRVIAEEGGALRAVGDLGAHWFDLIASITGLEVASVCADLKTFLPTRQPPRGAAEETRNAVDSVAVETEDYGSVMLHFKGGATGCFTVSQVTAGRKNCLRYEIAGAEASLAWNSELPNNLWLGRRDKPNEMLIRDPALLAPSSQPLARYPGGHNEGFPDTLKELFRAVYDYIEAGDWRAPRSFPAFCDGHKQAILGDAILKSQRERRWIDVVELT